MRQGGAGAGQREGAAELGGQCLVVGPAVLTLVKMVAGLGKVAAGHAAVPVAGTGRRPVVAHGQVGSDWVGPVAVGFAVMLEWSLQGAKAVRGVAELGVCGRPVVLVAFVGL